MDTSRRFLSASFTALPGFVVLLFFLQTTWFGEYWWATYLSALIVLVISSLLFGFAFPTIFHKLKLNHTWLRIFLQGLLAWVIAILALGLLNLTPLCVGQNNGDGNNDVRMCVAMTLLSGIVYSPLYLGLLTLSAFAGHWVLKIFRERSMTTT